MSRDLTYRLRLFFVLMAMTTIVLYAGSTDRSAIAQESSDVYHGFIAIIKEPPLDLESSFRNWKEIGTVDVLSLMAIKDSNEVGTDYNNIKSIVALIDGPIEKGKKIQLTFREFDGTIKFYTEEFLINHDPKGGPILIITPFRKKRQMSVTVSARVGEITVVTRKFQVSGPPFSP